MSDAQHTPGPWATSSDGTPEWHTQVTVYAEDGGARVATVFENEANAALIAAAPDMLEALQRIERSQIRPSNKSTYGNQLVPADQVADLQRIARLAIAKAIG